MANRHSFLLVFPILFSAAVLYLLLSDELESTGESISAITGEEYNLQMIDSNPENNLPVFNRTYSHLLYAESVLRANETNHLSDSQMKNRTELLDHLNNYIVPEKPTGRHLSHSDGTENVVEYLIVQTSEPEIAGIILSELSENGIFETDHPAFLNWIEESGITKEELAMIQPLYFQNRNSGFEPLLF